MKKIQLFSNDLGVDLGTSNVLICSDKQGVVIREPSVVAVDKNTDKILQVINIVCGCIIVFYGIKLLLSFFQML